eukprot:3413500-Amphidinium_carterae.1
MEVRCRPWAVEQWQPSGKCNARKRAVAHVPRLWQPAAVAELRIRQLEHQQGAGRLLHLAF